MQKRDAEKLFKMTSQFYAQNATSFSNTRQSAWPGWERCVCAMNVLGRDTAGSENATKSEKFAQCDKFQHVNTLEIIDVACGNLRFETWLANEFPQLSFHAKAYDKCEDLLPDDMPRNVDFVLCDVGACLLELCEEKDSDAGNDNYEDSANSEGDTGGNGNGEESSGLRNPNKQDIFNTPNMANIAICFGFMHHIPLERSREKLIEMLLNAVLPGGYVAISFWCFSRNEKMKLRAEETTKMALEKLNNNRKLELGCELKSDRKIPHEGATSIDGKVPRNRKFQLESNIKLEDGDYLLGFNNSYETFRYCHSFTTEEIDNLVARAREHASFKIVDKFSSDGRGNNLNEYVILQKEK